MAVSEKQFQTMLQGLLLGAEQIDCKSVYTFREAAILTDNKGLVVTLQDGSKFQITIVGSGDTE